MKRNIIVVGALALLLVPNFCLPATANPIAAPACKDIPSCGVTGIIVGTQVVAGVLYYLVKNAAGIVHKVKAKQSVPPAHRSIHGAEEGEVYAGLVQSEEECKRKALVKGENELPKKGKGERVRGKGREEKTLTTGIEQVFLNRSNKKEDFFDT